MTQQNFITKVKNISTQIDIKNLYREIKIEHTQEIKKLKKEMEEYKIRRIGKYTITDILDLEKKDEIEINNITFIVHRNHIINKKVSIIKLFNENKNQISFLKINEKNIIFEHNDLKNILKLTEIKNIS